MKKQINKIQLTVLILCSAVLAFAQSKVETFDKYVEASRVDWKVPGMSIVVVQDGKVLLSKGYGVKELGKSEPVDTSTLFGSMSTTKAMVAVAMGILVDEGKVGWDDRVIKHLPDFRVADPYVTNEIKVRDLLTHNAGMGNADFLWALTPELTGDEIVRRMQHARPVYSLRGGFIYQNIMYLVAGKVIEKASGMSWERFMTERVFGPLAMKNTFPSIASSAAYSNKSRSHLTIKGKVEVIPEMSVGGAGPAGAVWSTSDDMGKWVTFLLGDGQPLLKPGTMSELFKPQVILPSTFYPTFRVTKPKWTTYGLGWFQHDYRGEKVDFHTGSLSGRTAIVGLIRDKKLGVYVFGNIDQEQLRHALMYKALDVFGFDDNSRDWSTELKKMYDTMAANAEQQNAALMAARLKDTKPSLALGSYAGRYTDPFAGDMEVRFSDGKLWLTAGKESSAELEHRQVDTFLVKWSKAWLGEDLLTFNLNPVNGEVVSLTMDGMTLRREATPR